MSSLKPVYCGNLDYDEKAQDVERLFDEFGPIERMDMKTGYAFIFMKDSRDGDDAIRSLDGMEFGRRRRRLRVEWAKGQGLTKKREDQRKKDCVPTNTLFVVNFDPGTTRERDLEKHFSQYGKLTRVQVKKNFGFVAFESLDDAVDARVACGNGVRFQGRDITVEYTASGTSWEDRSASQAQRGGGSSRRSPDYGRSRRSDSRGRHNRRDSRSPVRRHTRSGSPVRSSGHRSTRRRVSRSPPPRASPSVSPQRSVSPAQSPSRAISTSPRVEASKSPPQFLT